MVRDQTVRKLSLSFASPPYPAPAPLMSLINYSVQAQNATPDIIHTNPPHVFVVLFQASNLQPVLLVVSYLFMHIYYIIKLNGILLFNLPFRNLNHVFGKPSLTLRMRTPRSPRLSSLHASCYGIPAARTASFLPPLVHPTCRVFPP